MASATPSVPLTGALPSPTPSYASSRSAALPPASASSPTVDPRQRPQQPTARVSTAAKADALLLRIGRLARTADAGPAAGLLSAGRLPDELRLQVLDAVSGALARAIGGSSAIQQQVGLPGAEHAGLDADANAAVALFRALAPVLVISRPTFQTEPDHTGSSSPLQSSDLATKPAFGGGLLSKVFSFFMPAPPAPAPPRSAAAANAVSLPTRVFEETQGRPSESQIKAEPQTPESAVDPASLRQDLSERPASLTLPSHALSAIPGTSQGSLRSDGRENVPVLSPTILPGSASRPSERRSPSAGSSADGSASGVQKTFSRPSWMDDALARRDEARSSFRPTPPPHFPPSSHPSYISHPPPSSGYPLKRPSSDPTPPADYYPRPPGGPPPPLVSMGGFDGYDDGRYKRPRMDDPYAPDWARQPASNDGGPRFALPPGGQRPPFSYPPQPLLPPMMMHQQPAGPLAGPSRQAPQPPATRAISKNHCYRCGFKDHNVHECKDPRTKAGLQCLTAEPAQNGKYIAMRFGEQTLCFSFTSGNKCPSHNCRQAHICPICRSTDHGAAACPVPSAREPPDVVGPPGQVRRN